MTNVFFRHLSETQVKLVLVFGVLHWVMGGVVCYCIDGVKIVAPRHDAPPPPQRSGSLDSEWHSASDFLLPGNRKSILPAAYWRSRLARGIPHAPGRPRSGS